MIYHPPGPWTADDDFRLNQIIRETPRPIPLVNVKDSAGRIVAVMPVEQAPPEQAWHKNRRRT